MSRPVPRTVSKGGGQVAGSRSIRVALGAAAALVALALGAAPAGAAFGVSLFDGGTFGPPPPGTTNPFISGPAFTQAGGHPYEAWTAFQMNRVATPGGFVRPDGGRLRNVRVDLPPGLIGNPTAVPTCPRTRRIPADTTDVFTSDPQEFCPPASVVGLAMLTFNGDPGTVEHRPAVIFNVEPPSGVAASFGFSFANAPAFLDATVRADGEYAITVRARNVNSAAAVLGVRVALWGVPADSSHDAQRCIFLLPADVRTLPPLCTNNPGAEPGTPLGPNSFPDTLDRRAFLTLPTACTPPGVGLATRMHLESWDPTSPPADAEFISHLPPGYQGEDNPDPSTWGPPQGPTGCDRLPFDPSFSARPDSSAPDSPTGLTVNLGFPQGGLEEPDGLATANVRGVRVTLPDGMTINPSAADGLAACPDERAHVGSASPADCAEASKIATVTAVTPLLEKPLSGAVYIGSQLSDDPESGDMFRLILALKEPDRGVFVNLLGRVRADRSTGRLVATFEGNPQLPFSELSLHFKDGPRAPLAMPPDCGTKTVDAEMSSWGGQVVHRSDSFTVECTPGLGGFAPAFSAGTASARAGAASPLMVRIARPDRQQVLSGVTVELPPGLLGKLKGIPLCPDQPANAGTCGVESRVGTATVGAGPGSNPFFLQGSVSLTGPYKGAPFGLAVAVRAIAGPFDLGMVVVRQAIFVDPNDAHITVVSDPLPTIVKGVPLRLRSVNVDIDRPGFTLNPTSCAPMQIRATLASDLGAVHQAAQQFQASDCRARGFDPKLEMTLSGRKETKDGGHPQLTARLTQAAGQANLRLAKVSLPLSMALDPETSQIVCSLQAAAAINCPANTIVGTAKAVTPVLEHPLSGKVFLVQGVRTRAGRQIRTLPTLLVPLRGADNVEINLRAQTSVERDKLVTTFPTIPDAPVSDFELTINGGAKGILVVTNNRDLCAGTQTARAAEIAHNDKTKRVNVRMKTPCGFRVVSTRVGSTSVSVKVGGLGAGRVTVSGRGVRRTSRTIRAASVATVRARLTRVGRRMRARGRPIRVRASFRARGAKRVRTTRATIRTAKKKAVSPERRR